MSGRSKDRIWSAQAKFAWSLHGIFTKRRGIWGPRHQSSTPCCFLTSSYCSIKSFKSPKKLTIQPHFKQANDPLPCSLLISYCCFYSCTIVVGQFYFLKKIYTLLYSHYFCFFFRLPTYSLRKQMPESTLWQWEKKALLHKAIERESRKEEKKKIKLLVDNHFEEGEKNSQLRKLFYVCTHYMYGWRRWWWWWWCSF